MLFIKHLITSTLPIASGKKDMDHHLPLHMPFPVLIDPHWFYLASK